MEHPIIITSSGEVCDRDATYSGILNKYLSTPAGRAQLAASMIQPFRKNLDYAGIARQCLTIQPLPPGASSIYYYNKDDDDV